MMIKDQKIEKFLEEVASSAPTPGGGAVAAAAAAAAAALVEMVVNLTKTEEVSKLASYEVKKLGTKAREMRTDLLALADEDVKAFEAVMAAFRIPKNDAGRKTKIQNAFKGAAETPLKIAKLAKEVNILAKEILKVGNKNAASDAKTATYLSEAAKKSAIANVEINLAYIKDEGFVKKFKGEVANL